MTYLKVYSYGTAQWQLDTRMRVNSEKRVQVNLMNVYQTRAGAQHN